MKTVFKIIKKIISLIFQQEEVLLSNPTKKFYFIRTGEVPKRQISRDEEIQNLNKLYENMIKWKKEYYPEQYEKERSLK